MTDNHSHNDSPAGDEAWFSRQYARLTRDEPDAALDAAVMAAAHGAAKAGRQTRRGYLLPMALAASLVVVVSGALLYRVPGAAPTVTNPSTAATTAPDGINPEDTSPNEDQLGLYVPCQRVRGAYLVPERLDPMVACPREDYWIVSLRVAHNACRESQIPVNGNPMFDAEPDSDGIEVVVLNDSAGKRRLRCTAGGWRVTT